MKDLLIRLIPFAAAAAFLSASLSAHADPMDDFTIIGGGYDVSFSTPASEPGIGAYVDLPTTNGMVNGVAQNIGVSIVLNNGSADSDTLNLQWGSTYSPADALNFELPALYQIT